MNTLAHNPAPLMLMSKPASTTQSPGPEPLVRMDRVVEYIGDDPEVQHQVFDMCLDLVATNLPQLRQAIATSDVTVLQRIAHHARGSLGMLGLSTLQELGEEIEYHYDDLGVERWRQRCQELYELFEHLQQELQQRLAA